MATEACAHGSWGGRRLSLGGEVTVTGPRAGRPLLEGVKVANGLGEEPTMKTPSRRRVVFFVLLMVVSAARSEAAPTIEWVPSSLLATISAGQRSTAVVSFTSSATIGGPVHIRVVPELAQHVTVTPSSFDDVTAGQPRTVSLAFAAAERSPVGTLDGVIQIRAQNKTLGRPLPVTLTIEEGPATATLPFWLSYCADPTCGGLEPLVVQICPEATPSCAASRETTVVPQVDGHQINHILFPVQTPAAFTGVYVSGPGAVLGTLVISRTSPVILRSDVDVSLSYYGVAPVWGGITSLNFVSSTMASPELISTVFRYPTFLVNDEAAQLHERGRDIIVQESAIANIHPGQMQAWFLPSELATLGEGNFSDGNLHITINYGNPDYINAIGSVFATALPRFAHEYVHELFSEISESYPGNNSCLNEGLADAFAFAAGFLPEADFGPVGLRGADFNAGCAEIAESFEVHDAGNCPFWQVRRLGLLSQIFVGRMLHPQHVIEFDSCDLTSERTGNALLVLFSEAAGSDMTQAIDMAEIPNAGSFEAARLALGL